jgi:Flp pilus assembly protein TadD
MERAWWIAGPLLLTAGCVDTNTLERVQQYNEIGLNAYEHGEYRAARESFQAALTLEPEDAALMYNVGQCYDRLGDVAKAEQFYQKCLLRAPNHAACRHALADLWVRAGRRPEAEKMVEDWLKREPNLASALAEDGWLWHVRGDLPKAQGRLHDALKLDPHDLRALTELAIVYEELHRPDRALVLYERCLAINPRQPDIAARVQQLRQNAVGPPRRE